VRLGRVSEASCSFLSDFYGQLDGGLLSSGSGHLSPVARCLLYYITKASRRLVGKYGNRLKSPE
jgi:hypothetical protein